MVRRGLRVAGRGAAVGLVGYHAWLFAGRLRDDSLNQPEVWLRWLMAAALVGLALFFRRRGLSILRGRPAIIFWVLALLLHLGPLPMPALREPMVGALSLLPWTLAAALVATTLVRRLSRPRLPGWARAPRGSASISRWDNVPPLALRFTPRPPPAA